MVGGSVKGKIDFSRDVDWFELQIAVGSTYQIDLEGEDTGSGAPVAAGHEMRKGPRICPPPSVAAQRPAPTGSFFRSRSKLNAHWNRDVEAGFAPLGQQPP